MDARGRPPDDVARAPSNPPGSGRRAPVLRRWGAVLGLAMLAPVCAEFLVAYLDITGDLGKSLFAIVYFMPLYGGAACAGGVGRCWPRPSGWR